LYTFNWTVTKESTELYAKSTGNLNPIFYSSASSKEDGFKTIPAPSSYLAQYQYCLDPTQRVPQGGVHISSKLKLYRPVFIGDNITLSTTVENRVDKKGRELLIYITEYYNQHDEIVAKQEMSNLLPKRLEG
jgi:acyl dehydratase